MCSTNGHACMHAYRTCSVLAYLQTVPAPLLPALQVPPHLPRSALRITIQPQHLAVTNRLTGQPYLSGVLHRTVVPGDSTWTLGGGQGEEGLMLVLAKMNLELYARWAGAGGLEVWVGWMGECATSVKCVGVKCG